MRPPFYFPVTDAPLQMRAGLRPLGSDFGNGALDAHYLQRDAHAGRYRVAKAAVPAARHGIADEEAPWAAAHDAMFAWWREVLARELGLQVAALSDDGVPRLVRWQAISEFVQEDFALIHRGTSDEGRAIGLCVSFPSGWRPERLLGASFADIHGPVPGFADHPDAARSMVRAMVERGPYVRFVWTVAGDDALDHHPEEGQRTPWPAAARAYFRVERQITVPLPAVDASLFLIRTYITPTEELSGSQCATLAAALRALPEPVARYKGLYEHRERILALIEERARLPPP